MIRGGPAYVEKLNPRKRAHHFARWVRAHTYDLAGSFLLAPYLAGSTVIHGL